MAVTTMATGCEGYLPKRGCAKCALRPSNPSPSSDNSYRHEKSSPVDYCCPLLPHQIRPPEQRCVKIGREHLTDESLTPNVAPMSQWITLGYHLQPPNQTRKDYVSPLVKKRQLPKQAAKFMPTPEHTGGVIVECARIMGRTKPITCFIPQFTDQPPYYVGPKRGVIEGPEFFVSRAEKGPEAIFPFPQRECFQAPAGPPQGPPQGTQDVRAGKGQHVTGTGSDRAENFPSSTERAGNDTSGAFQNTPAHQSNSDWPPCERIKPFWYLRSRGNPKRPVGNPNDYAFCKLRHDKIPLTHVEDLELDEVKNYIPGEVVNATRLSPPKTTLSATAGQSDGSADQRPFATYGSPAVLPRYKTKVPRIQPPEETFMIDPWIGSDEQFSRVGGFYKTVIIKALNDKYPSIQSPFKPRKFVKML